MKKALTLVAAVLAASTVASAQAQSQSLTPWYGGASIGSSRSNVSAGDVNNFLRSLGYGSPSTSVDDKDSAYKFLLKKPNIV